MEVDPVPERWDYFKAQTMGNVYNYSHNCGHIPLLESYEAEMHTV